MQSMEGPSLHSLGARIPWARYRDNGMPIVHATVRAWLEACERRAGLDVQGCLHKLVTRFARIWQCAAPRPRPFRNSLVTRT